MGYGLWVMGCCHLLLPKILLNPFSAVAHQAHKIMRLVLGGPESTDKVRYEVGYRMESHFRLSL